MGINIDAKVDLEYSDNFVAFLDVLGFRELVMSKNQEQKKKICQYFGIIESAMMYFQNIAGKSEIKKIVISDSVILSLSKTNSLRDNIDLFRNLCIAIGLIQQNLAKKDIWIRGGISSGEVSFDEDRRQIVGPAYVKAYDLENKYAKWPRVIVDSNIIHELDFPTSGACIDFMNLKNQGGLNYVNWKANVLFDWNQGLYDPGVYIRQDIPMFIDYLSPNCDFRLNELKRIIKLLKKELYEDIRFYKKYRWVVDYLKSIYLCGKDNDEDIERELANL